MKMDIYSFSEKLKKEIKEEIKEMRPKDNNVEKIVNHYVGNLCTVLGLIFKNETSYLIKFLEKLAQNKKKVFNIMETLYKQNKRDIGNLIMSLKEKNIISEQDYKSYNQKYNEFLKSLLKK